MIERDRELVAGLLRGERAAFDGFFNEYFPKLYRFVKRRMPHDAAGAEDVAQATLCRALGWLHTWRGEAALFTWLCTLCRRELAARWRENGGYATSSALSEDDPAVRAALESLLMSETDPLLAADRAQVRAAIRAALDYLPTPYAEVLEWKYLRELSLAQIAQRLGRSPKAAESLLTRARDAFREAFSLLHADPTGEPR